jgi:hypothetical protein
MEEKITGRFLFQLLVQPRLKRLTENSFMRLEDKSMVVGKGGLESEWQTHPAESGKKKTYTHVLRIRAPS